MDIHPTIGTTERLHARIDSVVMERARRVTWWSGEKVSMTSLVTIGLRAVCDIYDSQAALLTHDETGEQHIKPAGVAYPPRQEMAKAPPKGE